MQLTFLNDFPSQKRYNKLQHSQEAARFKNKNKKIRTLHEIFGDKIPCARKCSQHANNTSRLNLPLLLQNIQI